MPKNGLDSTRRRKRNDFVFISAILIAVIVCLLFFKMNQKTGAFVTVTVDGNVVEELSLEKDITKELTTDDGYNILKIHNGEVTMEDADCPDKICVNHRAISSAGEVIVCLPHKVVVEITEKDGQTNSKGFDAISK